MPSTHLNTQNKIRRRSKRILRLSVYAMLGALMFCSKVAMEALPNIHLVGMLTMTYTIVLRFRALIPIYVYVMLDGVMQGFSVWWLPYLYAFTILWAITMLFPKKMPRSVGTVVYPAVCALHGLFFGTLYAPVLIWVQGFDLTQTITWLSAGLSFDLLHFFGNLMAGLLILPLSELLKRLTKNMY